MKDFEIDLEQERLGLSREQEKRLIAGDYSDLTFEKKPTVEPGYCYVLSWAKAYQVDDGQGNKKKIPAKPLRWIQVTNVVPKRRGGFTVSFDVYDNRDPDRFIRRTPPVVVPIRDEKPPTAHALSKASEESNYTANPASAVERTPTTPRKYIPPDNAELHRKQVQLAKKDAMTPEQRLHAELEELRRFHPDDAQRYERQVDVLADKMESLRRKKAA